MGVFGFAMAGFLSVFLRLLDLFAVTVAAAAVSVALAANESMDEEASCGHPTETV